MKQKSMKVLTAFLISGILFALINVAYSKIKEDEFSLNSLKFKTVHADPEIIVGPLCYATQEICVVWYDDVPPLFLKGTPY